MRFPFTPAAVDRDPFADNPELFYEVLEKQVIMMAALWAAGAWDLADEAARERFIAEGLFKLDARGHPGVTRKLLPRAMEIAMKAMVDFKNQVTETVTNSEKRDAAPRN